LDDAIRIGILVAVGLALLLTVAWYLRFVYQEISGTGQVVIDQFTVIRADGKSDADTGNALAQMLQARLQSLVRELRDAQTELATNASAPIGTEGRLDTPLGGTRVVEGGIETSLLDPVDMKLSVAGVDVGGVVPWIQRSLISRRTLHFAVHLEEADAQVSGAISALGISNGGLRLSIDGVNAKPPSLGLISDQLAHEILRRYLAEQPSNRLEVFDTTEFVSLSNTLIEAARLNRKANLSGTPQPAFAGLIAQMATLADQAPSWPELGYYVARTAEYGQNETTALQYYKKILPRFEADRKTDLADFVKARIASLSAKLAASQPELAALGPQQAAAPTNAAALPPSIDHTAEIKLIHDSGSEGSVVGQALASALEYEFHEAGQNVQISSRYIYYAARKSGGLDIKMDSGAFIKDGIAVLAAEGAVEENIWPYKPGEFAKEPPPAVAGAKRYKIKDVRQLQTIQDIKLALAQNDPVIVGISVFESMMGLKVAKTGVVPLPSDKESPFGGHAVVLVGYDDATNRVKFVNSWGTEWGDGGFGYLPYAYLEKYMSDAWTFKLAGS
jgi:hypothetical protein